MGKNKKRVLEAVKFFKECLKETAIKNLKVVLFGSYSQGHPTIESDIDLIVILSDLEGKSIFERVALTKEAEVRTIKKFLVPLDVIDLTPTEFENESSLAASFAKNGMAV